MTHHSDAGRRAMEGASKPLVSSAFDVCLSPNGAGNLLPKLESGGSAQALCYLHVNLGSSTSWESR